MGTPWDLFFTGILQASHDISTWRLHLPPGFRPGRLHRATHSSKEAKEAPTSRLWNSASHQQVAAQTTNARVVKWGVVWSSQTWLSEPQRTGDLSTEE